MARRAGIRRRLVGDMGWCAICGAPLDVGERCNCDRQSAVLPRDGLRAVCHRFGHRSSYRGKCYITCSGRRFVFGSVEERDGHYRLYCCGTCTRCAMYGTDKEG